jgi:transposase
MIAVGIDVGKRAHEACFLDQAGQEKGKGLRFANTSAGLGELQARLQSLGEPVTIALEASGHYWLGIQRRLVARGYVVQVINPLQTDAFRDSGIRRTKTDRRDAFILADLVRIGRTRPNYVPDDTILQLRELTRFRWALADQIGDAKRRILTVLDRVFPEFAGQFADPFGATARELLDRAASAADFAALDLGVLTDLVESTSRHRFGADKAQALHQCARDSLGLAALGPSAQLEIRSLLAQIALIEKQVAEVDRAIAALVTTIPQHLTSIPGVGPVLAATILAELGDVSRFPTVPALVAYAGLDPSVFESGQFQGRRQHLSKRGSPYLRRALYLAAHSAHPRNPDWHAYLERKMKQGMPYRAALIAVARKLLICAYTLLREDRPFEVREATHDAPA